MPVAWEETDLWSGCRERCNRRALYLDLLPGGRGPLFLVLLDVLSGASHAWLPAVEPVKLMLGLAWEECSGAASPLLTEKPPDICPRQGCGLAGEEKELTAEDNLAG